MVIPIYKSVKSGSEHDGAERYRGIDCLLTNMRLEIGLGCCYNNTDGTLVYVFEAEYGATSCGQTYPTIPVP